MAVGPEAQTVEVVPDDEGGIAGIVTITPDALQGAWESALNEAFVPEWQGGGIGDLINIVGTGNNDNNQ